MVDYQWKSIQISWKSAKTNHMKISFFHCDCVINEGNLKKICYEIAASKVKQAKYT